MAEIRCLPFRYALGGRLESLELIAKSGSKASSHLKDHASSPSIRLLLSRRSWWQRTADEYSTVVTSINLTLDPERDHIEVRYSRQLVTMSGKESRIIAQFFHSLSYHDGLTLWNQLPRDQRPRDGFLIATLYLAWLDCTNQVEPNSRATGRIIPAKLAQVVPSDHRAGKLITAAAHIAPERRFESGQTAFFGSEVTGSYRAQSIMPGFKDDAVIGPCLQLVLYELGSAPAISPGPAAPLPLRLFV